MPNPLIKTTVIALTLSLFACFAQADATPRFTLNDLTSPALPVEKTGYYGYGHGYGHGYGGYGHGYGGYGHGYGGYGHGYGGYGHGYGGYGHGYGGYSHGYGGYGRGYGRGYH